MPRSYVQRYCSIECRKKDVYVHKPVRKEEPSEEYTATKEIRQKPIRNNQPSINLRFLNRICEWCGRSLPLDMRSHARFCSDSCRVKSSRARACYYCGIPADTKDHVIPKVFTEMLLAIGEYKGGMGKTVPACSECNSTAGPRVFETAQKKQEYIKQRYRRRYRKLLESPDWSEIELKDLGYSLQSHIRGSQQAKQLLKKRLRWKLQ